MKLVGMMRVKNEARWIRPVLEAALRICAEIHVMDDHSTDDTAAICATLSPRQVTIYSSPFSGLDEARDKNWLIEQVKKSGADWVLAIDGDELLADHQVIGYAMHKRLSDCYSLRVVYLWDREDQVRIDGVYGRFWRPSLFRLLPNHSFRSTLNGGNFHCGNVPQNFHSSVPCGARLLHFGYMDAADRRRKFDWYNQQDPRNYVEDQYRHMIQGDPGGPEAHLRLRHAGPLALSQLGRDPLAISSDGDRNAVSGDVSSSAQQ